MANIAQAQTCLSGNCTNGLGTLLNIDGDTVIGKFADGKINGEMLYAGRNHKIYVIASTYYNYYFFKNDSVLRVGKGTIKGDKIERGYNFPNYYSYPSGNLELYYGKQKMILRKGEPIMGFWENYDNNGSSLELRSNGKDFMVIRLINNKRINGMMHINRDTKFAHFTFDSSGNISFPTVTDKVCFNSNADIILKYKYSGEHYLNFGNLEKCRNLAALEKEIDSIQNLEFYKKYFSIMNQLKVFNTLTEKKTYNENYTSWTEILRDEIIAICKTQYSKEYEKYLFTKKISSLPTNQGTILYNVSRNAQSEISYLDEDSDEAYPFFKSAFKQAFENLLKKRVWIVPNEQTAKKYYGKNAKEFEFKVKLDQ